MIVEITSDMRALTEAKIPLDTYAQVMDLAADFGFEETDDPVQDFEDAIKMLNDEESLPSWLGEWCVVYGIDHNEMDLEPPEDDFEI